MVIALSEPCCVFLVDDSKVYWQWFGPTRAGWQRKGSGPLFCFSIVAQRPRVAPPSRPGAVDGLLVPLAHGLIRTLCEEIESSNFSIVAQRPCVRTSPSGGRQDKKQDLLSFIFSIFFLMPFSSIPLSDCHFDLCLRLWMARHTMRQGRCTRGMCP